MNTDNPLYFPASTLVAKNVPKNAFYKRAKAQRTTALRTFLTEAFAHILWLYKLHPSTLNIADGQQVHEIDVFYCKMRTTKIDEKLLGELDMLLPRHTLYIIDRDGSTDLVMFPKTINAQGHIAQNGKMEAWTNVDLSATPLTITGHDMDMSHLNTRTEAEYAKAAEQRQQQELLKRQYAALQKKIKNEKQFSRQLEMNRELKALKDKMAL